MILFYDDGPVSRVRIDFSDLPNLQALAVVKTRVDRMANEQKLYDAAIVVLANRPQHADPNCKNDGDSFLVSGDTGTFRHCDKCGVQRQSDVPKQYSVLTYQNNKVWLTIT